MKNLTGSMIFLDKKEEEQTNNTRYIETSWGQQKEYLSTNSKCCVCQEYFWIEDNGVGSTLNEGFGVLDARAYENSRLPDYIKNSHVLLECHWTCRNILNENLATGKIYQ